MNVILFKGWLVFYHNARSVSQRLARRDQQRPSAGEQLHHHNAFVAARATRDNACCRARCQEKCAQKKVLLNSAQRKEVLEPGARLARSQNIVLMLIQRVWVKARVPQTFIDSPSDWLAHFSLFQKARVPRATFPQTRAARVTRFFFLREQPLFALSPRVLSSWCTLESLVFAEPQVASCFKARDFIPRRRVSAKVNKYSPKRVMRTVALWRFD